jgi:hypothetical protein
LSPRTLAVYLIRFSILMDHHRASTSIALDFWAAGASSFEFVFPEVKATSDLREGNDVHIHVI